MFEVSWRPIISAFSYAFTHFDNDHMLQRVIAGFQQCATLAGRFNLPEVFDQVVLALARITDLTQLPSTDTNFPNIAAEGQSLTISPLSIRFGKNFKAQLATVVLFTIANTDGNTMRQGWLCIFEIIQSLFAHSLLPAKILLLPDFVNISNIALRAPKSPSHASERRPDAGLLSTLSSYLLSPYVGPQDGIGRDITDDDVESTLCAVDCLASCHISELYNTILLVTATAFLLGQDFILTQGLTYSVDWILTFKRTSSERSFHSQIEGFTNRVGTEPEPLLAHLPLHLNLNLIMTLVHSSCSN